MIPGPSGREPDISDPISLEEFGREARSYLSSGGSARGISTDGPFHAGARSERRDFDDGANAFWSLYGKEAQSHDEARFLSLAADMEGSLLFGGLFSLVLTSFLVQTVPTLQADPAQVSAYYQQQSVAMLSQISMQIASIAPQVSIAAAPPPPYPQFRPSFSDIRVNALWLTGLVCSLSAALSATLVRQWVRSYMKVFQQHDHPLKRARFRQFYSQRAGGMLKLAGAVTRLIHISLFLFFLGLNDVLLNINTTLGFTSAVTIFSAGAFYLYNVAVNQIASPYQIPILRPISFMMRDFPRTFFGSRVLRNWRTPTSIEAYQEELVMDETEERKERDVRAVRWLVDNTTANANMEPLVLAIPGTFNTEWGREVWIDVTSQARSDHATPEPQTDHSATGGSASLMNHSPRPLVGTAADTICRSVRYLFETCNNHGYFMNEEARRRRMRACVEATASLVCCIDFRLDWFGEVAKPVSEIGRIENINQLPMTVSDPSFMIRWTCLSLVNIRQILSSNRLRVLAGYAVTGMARFQSEFGRPDGAAWASAERVEECLKTAWNRAEELRQAFEPWTQNKTREKVEEILRNHDHQISELERIKAEADGMADIDQRITLYQDAMDDATHRLTRQLPGVSFDELRRSESLLLSDTFNTPATPIAPITPQLIFPGQQVRALATLGQKLREVLNGPVADGYEEVLESLKSVDQIALSLRRPDGLMKRQLWRLQDLRDGGGFGFTIELFFLSLRRLLSIPSLHGSSSIFYIGTFKVITSNLEENRDSLGTQQILLSLICDLIIQDRGIFSGFLYPEPITTMLIDMIGKMLQAYTGPDWHIRNAVWEIESVSSGMCMNMSLQRRALAALRRSRGVDTT
ncbi:hypothetical protein V8E53_006272 [Lactarius tabidus]